ncbi:hypothetical protein MTO96_024903 [Rhipicephalus appendiculatus]
MKSAFALALSCATFLVASYAKDDGGRGRPRTPDIVRNIIAVTEMLVRLVVPEDEARHNLHGHLEAVEWCFRKGEGLDVELIRRASRCFVRKIVEFGKRYWVTHEHVQNVDNIIECLKESFPAAVICFERVVLRWLLVTNLQWGSVSKEKERPTKMLTRTTKSSSHVSFKWILLCCAVAFVAAQLDPCPAPESLSPCGCDFTGINCFKAKNVSQLARAFSGTEKTMHKALWIQGVPADAINAGTFGEFVFGKANVEVCNLTSFELLALNNSAKFLSELSLFGNRLTEIDYKRINIFENLRLLNLAKNNISSVPAFAFKNPSLERLLLNENPISSIGAFAFRNLPRLKELELRFIRVKKLADYSFSIPRHNPYLTIILSAGQLESIEEKAFRGVAPFTLRLTMNKLQEFSRPVFQPLMEAMTKNAKRINELGQARIETRGNRFTCRGCSFSWLTTLQGRPDLFLMLLDFQCTDRTAVWNVTNSLIGCPRGG